VQSQCLFVRTHDLLVLSGSALLKLTGFEPLLMEPEHLLGDVTGVQLCQSLENMLFDLVHLSDVILLGQVSNSLCLMR
ncbi:MAG: hypothetical protein ACK559_39740, partial [bacterium]